MASSIVARLIAPVQVPRTRLDGQGVPLEQAASKYCTERCYRAGSEEECQDLTQCLGLYLDQHFGIEAENPHLDFDLSSS
ncbi:MAG: hypothetical protein KA731_02530 [Candidatus Moranbacteria bacterium]|nr:hypothetical protein [Candidatus Moranbacteria bacterium]MBP6034178.1 hypothetical protein [Candidatus Moranbacteria bacterium]MBP7696136.1 hypothetical protein [Candidatus Moranbacteria bacterium]